MLSPKSLLSILWFSLLGIIQVVRGQQLLDQDVVSHYLHAHQLAPREKIYVHLDRDAFMAPDTIWFKAYLNHNLEVDTASWSGVVHIELVDSEGASVYRVALPALFGLSWGAIALDEKKFPVGNYTFRAYTRWSRNFGEDFMFTKNIRVYPKQNGTTLDKTLSAYVLPNKSKHSKSAIQHLDIDVQFLPEGGSLIEGPLQTIGFKVLNQQGKGVPVAGEIFGTDNQLITRFRSNRLGMGYFELAPERGAVYKAKIKYGDHWFDFGMPVVKASGYALKVHPTYAKDSIEINVFSSLAGTSLTLIGQSRGTLCFTAPLKPIAGKKVLRVAKSLFPGGVSQILLKNSQNQTINERNFFIPYATQLNIEIAAKNGSYHRLDSIAIDLSVNDSDGIPASGSFSVAVTDNRVVSKDSVNDENICSAMLLSSDLKGEIEAPGYYFHRPDSKTYDDLDALMLTQGWVSYDWDASKPLTFTVEKEFTISGKVQNLLNKPAIGGKVILAGQNRSFLVLDTVTDDKGNFIFDKLPVLDSASLLIQARNVKNRKGTLEVVVDEPDSPPYTVLSEKVGTDGPLEPDSVVEQMIQEKSSVWKLTANEGINLREVVISAKRSVKGSKNLNGAGLASQTIVESDLIPMSKKTLYQVILEKVRGFNDGGGEFFVNRIPARFVIDGQSLDFFYDPSGITLGYSPKDMPSNPLPFSYREFILDFLRYFNGEDVAGIEVMENSFSSAYRSRYVDAKSTQFFTFIEITTKSGLGPFYKKSANVYLINQINYGNNKTFYSPKYINPKVAMDKAEFRPTLYWNPNVLTGRQGKASFSFFAGNRKTTYRVWVEGKDRYGHVGMKTYDIQIE